MTVEGKQYAVIGGHGAIGGAVAAALRQAGATAHTLDRPGDIVEDGALPDMSIDLAHEETFTYALDEYYSTYGVPDGLVVASGMYPAKLFSKMTLSEIETLFKVNSIAPAMILSQYAQELEAANMRGTAVVTSSKGADQYRVGTTAYTGSKAALNAMVRGLTLETAFSGLRANIIAPGYVSTHSKLNPIPSSYEDRVLDRGIEDRLCAPPDLVGTYLWLLGSGSYWVRGEIITVDGGLSIGDPHDQAWIA